MWGTGGSRPQNPQSPLCPVCSAYAPPPAARYVTPENYFASLGLTPQEVDAIRAALMTPEGLALQQQARSEPAARI